VRERGPASSGITLDLALLDYDAGYWRELEPLVERHRSWIRVHRNVEREPLARLLSRSRYAIHGMREEPFGMAVAEALLAGAIPFAPAGGGPVEILGGDERLLFSSRDDAVAKIGAVLSSRALQDELRERLASRQPLFTAERFVKHLRELVTGFATQPAPVRQVISR